MRMFFIAIYAAAVLAGGPYKNLRAQNLESISIALVDTTERDQWLYRPLISILESTGFKVTYKSLDTVINQPINRLALPRYKAVFFVIGNGFLSSLNGSHLCAKVLSALDQYARMPGVLVGLLFPSLNIPQGTNIIGALEPLFGKLGLFDCKPGSEFLASKAAQQFLKLSNIFLTMSPESRPLMYHTTLNLPHSGVAFDLDQIEQTLGTEKSPLAFLPVNRDSSNIVRQTLPYGLYYFNALRKNHIFIGNTSQLTFSSIAENFHLCPIDFNLRHEMLSLTQRMLFELAIVSHLNDGITITQTLPLLKHAQAPVLPSTINSLRFATLRDSHASRKTAWMEITIFQDPTPEQRTKQPTIVADQEKQQDQLIDYIFESGLDALWITLNPHMYFSPIGRSAKPADQQNFIASITRFTKKLAAGAKRYGTKPPALLVGYEITNNIYEPNMPVHFAVDMYHNAYQDLPNPINSVFWRQEVIKPLEVLVKKWNDPMIGHNIPLTGVVLDLEMYCRKKTGSFSTTMGFNAETFKKFLKQMHLPVANVALRDRVLLLMKQQMGDTYFRFLENEAQMIGTSMQTHFNRLIPHCKIMCYLPQINISWFYKGLYKGLTRNNQPLQLLTFNSEFFEHEQWFENNHIPVEHASVLLLSKLKNTDDFGWVDYLLSRHQGIWLNRFSRFIEPTAHDWTSVEQPRMDTGLYRSFMEYLKNN